MLYVIYFTWSGRTGEMARIISRLTGASIQEILPETPYALNYNAVVNQGKKEISAKFQPPIKKLDLDLSQYDVFFIGTPIWWGTMAPPITTFLKKMIFVGRFVPRWIINFYIRILHSVIFIVETGLKMLKTLVAQGFSDKFWRRGRDLNPRAVSGKLISSERKERRGCSRSLKAV